jgi:hypothetical protein
MLRTSKDRLTQSSLLDLLCSQSKGREQFDDDLPNNLCHDPRRRDFCINTKALDKIPEGLEQVEECIVTPNHVLDSLRYLDIRYHKNTRLGNKEDTYGE